MERGRGGEDGGERRGERRRGAEEIGRRWGGARDERDDYERRKRILEVNPARGGVERSDRDERSVKRSSGERRSISRSRSRSRERERERKGREDGDRRGERRPRSEEGADYDDAKRDAKRRRYRGFGSRADYGRDRAYIGSRDCDRRGPPRVESRLLPCRDRGRERERPRGGGKEREKDVASEKVATIPALNGQVEGEKEKEGEEKARTYQLEVLAQAKVKNTIAFLETGAGKTLIAVLLMKEKYKLLREEGKRMLAVFLVPKVPLVYQVL